METWDRKNLPSAMGAQAPAIPVEQVYAQAGTGPSSGSSH